MLGSHWVEDFKGHEGGTSIVHLSKITHNTNKHDAATGAGRQHLEVNRQGSSTSVKQMAWNGFIARPAE